MSDPFLGEIQLYGFNFAPHGWAFCQGQPMLLSQHTSLFSLLGTIYGGDGRTTFALPDFRGMAACAQGPGPGLTPRQLGETFGAPEVTLTSGQMPMHTHTMRVYDQREADKRHGGPLPGDALTPPRHTTPFTGSPDVDTAFASGSLGPAGGSQPHENRQPYLALNFCIALDGTYPSRP